MPLKRIRLELARNPEYPNGSASHGYEFVAPLDDSEHLVAAEWTKERDRCSVKRSRKLHAAGCETSVNFPSFSLK
jgi:hypothetical protein